MSTAAETITDTARFAAYASKDALMLDLALIARGSTTSVQEMLYRLGNTTTSGWADPSRTVAQMEAANFTEGTPT